MTAFQLNPSVTTPPIADMRPCGLRQFLSIALEPFPEPALRADL
jgi:hypothetical protein